MSRAFHMTTVSHWLAVLFAGRVLLPSHRAHATLDTTSAADIRADSVQQHREATMAGLRFRLRPRAVATGTRTRRAGLSPLDSLYWDDARHGGDTLRGAFVYVPPRCVGTHRAPLVVFLHGQGMTGREMLEWNAGIVEKLADTYGFIVLAPSAEDANREWGGWETSTEASRIAGAHRIEAALRYVLQHDAIDPTRIALAGASAGGDMAIFTGLVNGDVFGRVLGFSPAISVQDPWSALRRAAHGQPPIFIQHGDTTVVHVMDVDLGNGKMQKMRVTGTDWDTHQPVDTLRRGGYAVTYQLDSGEHAMTDERAAAGFRWLASSWH